MRSIVLAGLCLVSFAACTDAQSRTPIRYEISFENRAHHEAEVTVTFDGLDEAPLELRMSRSSPGRYALHEFAKNVYNFRAKGAGGRDVTVARPNPHQWDVSGHGGSVTVTYTLYADRADGTYAGIDRTHGHLSMPATFMFARGQDHRPIELHIDIPDGSGWRVATQLAPTADPTTFTAPDLSYFMDSPTEVSDYWLHEWELDGETFRVALHHDGSDAEAERYAEATAKIVESARDIFGELASYDYGTYTFLACYHPWVFGDGMEHRNSTSLTSSGSLEANMMGLLGTVAHEFFHSWNMERIRSKELEPFDFERANMSSELWFGEGFTSYYDDLILWRAGLITDDDFAARMGGIADAVTNARGRRYFSPIEMSEQAPFVDAATALDPNNRQNTFLSYYTWGSGVALALDLTLRARFPGVTLDHLMREMWKTYGVTEQHYDVDDIEAALARVTGDRDFATDFFDRYIRGRDAADYPTLLAAAGVELGPEHPGQAWIGPLTFRFDRGAAVMNTTPLENTTLYEAGVDRGDRIVTIDGSSVSSRAALERVVGQERPGARIDIVYESRGGSYTRSASVGVDPSLAARWMPDATASAEQRSFREAWRSPTAGS